MQYCFTCRYKNLGTFSLSLVKMAYRKCNVTATASLSCNVDLKLLHQNETRSWYCPEKFPGLLLYLKKPNVTATIFKNGKMNIAGGLNEKDLRRAANIVSRRVRAACFKHLVSVTNKNMRATGPILTDFRITNIVVKMKVKGKINFEKMIEDNKSKFTYEPELFPGIHYRLAPNIVATIFHTGKIYVTGFKDISSAENYCMRIEMLLSLYEH